ncbi:MAG: Nramp family divalent metal transporter [Chloroflexota bacterium]|nr:Nramp family divalent metal transporter [Chloroflexota bacterium]
MAEVERVRAEEEAIAHAVGLGPEAVEDPRALHKVPDPFPLTMAGMFAALGPQAINFGISIGGGEAYLLPNVAARGTLHMHWLMIISVIIETSLVYECIKYSMCTGRSFFAATHTLRPYGFWPWFWAVAAIVTYAWPAWMAGAVVAAQRFTGISTQTLFPGSTLPPQYFWAVLALLLVLFIFYVSPRTYAFLEKFFILIMFANIALVLAITVVAARPEHYVQVLLGYLGITFLREGYPAALPLTDALALYNQPGGSLMWVSFWAVAAGWGMGRYAGQVTGVLAPPEKITAQELRWDENSPSERAKMKQWVKVGAYSLILWWAIIGGMIMTYLYSVAGLAYLNPQFQQTGQVPTGVEVPLQMATVAAGVLGQMAGWLMLLVIMVTLYDAQFPYYDTYIGRTTTDAVAVTGKTAGRTYRFWYFLVVTLAVLAGFYLVTVAQPFILWTIVAIASIVWRAIGSWQIMAINDKAIREQRLHPEFRVSGLNRALLWFSLISGLGAVAAWFIVVFPGEACRQAGIFC